MDKAMIESFVATLLAISALSITTFLSFRDSGAVRAHKQKAALLLLGQISDASVIGATISADLSQAASRSSACPGTGSMRLQACPQDMADG